MRKIICRFANQIDLDAFNKQNGLSLTKDVKEYDFRTNTATYKRTGKSKGFDTSWKPIWADMPDIVKIPVEWDGDKERDNREYIESHITECKKIFLDNFTL